MNRIVCVGNRLAEEDSAGPRVHDLLAAEGCGPGVELVDGGVGGLGLARLFDGVGTVVLVDGVVGFGRPGQVVVVPGDEVATLATDWGHGAGVPELLALMPVLCDGVPPQVWLVGLEPPAAPRAVREAAARARQLAQEAVHVGV